MPDCPGIFVDLVVVSSFERLVAEEVDRLVIHASRKILVILNVLQAVSLIPPGREDVERDLTTD